MSNELQRLADELAWEPTKKALNQARDILTALATVSADEPETAIIDDGYDNLVTKAYADHWRNKAMQLAVDNENLRTVMIAAAEEIQKYWHAHCDAEGYGPANLMRRLEMGIPSEYGYKAGDFERLRKENERLKATTRRLWDALTEIQGNTKEQHTADARLAALSGQSPGSAGDKS